MSYPHTHTHRHFIPHLKHLPSPSPSTSPHPRVEWCQQCSMIPSGYWVYGAFVARVSSTIAWADIVAEPICTTFVHFIGATRLWLGEFFCYVALFGPADVWGWPHPVQANPPLMEETLSFWYESRAIVVVFLFFFLASRYEKPNLASDQEDYGYMAPWASCTQFSWGGIKPHHSVFNHVRIGWSQLTFFQQWGPFFCFPFPAPLLHSTLCTGE